MTNLSQSRYQQLFPGRNGLLVTYVTVERDEYPDICVYFCIANRPACI